MGQDQRCCLTNKGEKIKRGIVNINIPSDPIVAQVQFY